MSRSAPVRYLGGSYNAPCAWLRLHCRSAIRWVNQRQPAVVVRVLVVVVGPVLVLMSVRRAGRRQLVGQVGVGAAQVPGVFVPRPAVGGHKVGHQQALAMMPAALVDIEVLLALGGALLLAQAVPLAVRVLLDRRGDIR